MGNYIVVDDASDEIVNRIVLDDPAQWQAPDGQTAYEETEPMQIGGTYIDGVYTPPPAPDPEPLPPVTPTFEDQVLFDHENRLRAIEGEPPLTLEDFRKRR